MVSFTKLLKRTFSSGSIRHRDTAAANPPPKSTNTKSVGKRKSKKSVEKKDPQSRSNSKNKLKESLKDEEIEESEISTNIDSENDKPTEQLETEEITTYDGESDYLSGSEDGQDDEGEEDFIGDLEPEEVLFHKEDWKTLSPEELIIEQQREIQAVADLLMIPLATSAMLLRHFLWRRERLMERYLESPEKTCKEAGIASNLLEKGADTMARESSSAIKLVGEAMCSICGEDVPAEQCTALSCLHRFCNECWRNYLAIKINEGTVTRIKCPDLKCSLAVDEHTVKRLVSPDVFDKFVRFITKSFVEDSDGRVKWCPQPNCGHAITADMITGTVVKCKCGYRFCFSCRKDAHSPATCEQVKLWARKCKDDSETTHWKYANTKDCPKCETPVEKNGGCNHMTCRQCKHEWCWVCIRPWKGHNDYYNCNKFMKPEKKKTSFLLLGRSRKKEKIKEREAAREKNRLALERYLHYLERYLNHFHSQELEKQMRGRASSQVSEMQSEVSTSSELQYIIDGTEELLECRNVLKYTYVFAYYLPENGSAKQLFEYLQMDLEKTTEQLSEILEAPASGQRLLALNMIQVAKTRKENLLNAVEQGLTEQP